MGRLVDQQGNRSQERTSDLTTGGEVSGICYHSTRHRSTRSNEQWADVSSRVDIPWWLPKNSCYEQDCPYRRSDIYGEDEQG